MQGIEWEHVDIHKKNGRVSAVPAMFLRDEQREIIILCRSVPNGGIEDGDVVIRCNSMNTSTDRLVVVDKGLTRGAGEMSEHLREIAHDHYRISWKKETVAEPSRKPAADQDAPLIDFVIITALEVERRAMCAAFGLSDDQREPRDSRVYWRGRLPLKNGGFYEIAVAQSSDMAGVDAALLTSDAIRHWNSGAALLVGIAAATTEKQNLGDIVVGSYVYYYERGKVTSEGAKPEPYMYQADFTLLNRVSALPDWTTEILAVRPDASANRPAVRIGVIASGEKVIASEAAREQISQVHRKIIAIEMEGYGFSKAIWQSFQPVRHLVVKSICDLADASKGDEWHPYAAAAAASFVKHFLLDKPIQPKNGQTQTQPGANPGTLYTHVDTGTLKMPGKLEQNGHPIFSKIRSDTQWGVSAWSLDRQDHTRLYKSGGQPISNVEGKPSDRDVSIMFEMTNTQALDLKVMALFVQIDSYFLVDILEATPAVSGGFVRKYYCNIAPSLGQYECVLTQDQPDYIKLAAGELETFDISVNTVHAGLYQMSVHLRYLVGATEFSVKVGDLHRLYGFFDFRAQPLEFKSDSVYFRPMWKRDPYLFLPEILGAGQIKD